MEVSPVRLPKALTRVTVTYEGLKRRSQRDKLHTFRQHSNSNTTTTTVCRHINVDTYLHLKHIYSTLFSLNMDTRIHLNMFDVIF